MILHNSNGLIDCKHFKLCGYTVLTLCLQLLAADDMFKKLKLLDFMTIHLSTNMPGTGLVNLKIGDEM